MTAGCSCCPACWLCKGTLQLSAEEVTECCTLSCLCRYLCLCLQGPDSRFCLIGHQRKGMFLCTRPERNPDIIMVESETGIRSALIVWWVLNSPGLSFPCQQQYSLVSTVRVTVLSHQMPLSTTRWLSWHHFCPLNTKEENSALTSMLKEKNIREWHVTEESRVPSLYQMLQLLHSASHSYWQYPASLQ